jgi:transposase
MPVLSKIGNSTKEVADIIKCSQRTVQRQLKKLKQTQSFANKDKPGRPKKFSDEIGNQIVAWVEEDRRRSSPNIRTMVLEKFEVDVSERTIRDLLELKGFFGGVCARKPLRREMNKAKRLAFTLEHVDKLMEFWKSILFTDEKKIELVNSKRRIYCWMRNMPQENSSINQFTNFSLIHLNLMFVNEYLFIFSYYFTS